MRVSLLVALLVALVALAALPAAAVRRAHGHRHSTDALDAPAADLVMLEAEPATAATTMPAVAAPVDAAAAAAPAPAVVPAVAPAATAAAMPAVTPAAAPAAAPVAAAPAAVPAVAAPAAAVAPAATPAAAPAAAAAVAPEQSIAAVIAQATAAAQSAAAAMAAPPAATSTPAPATTPASTPVSVTPAPATPATVTPAPATPAPATPAPAAPAAAAAAPAAAPAASAGQPPAGWTPPATLQDRTKAILNATAASASPASSSSSHSNGFESQFVDSMPVVWALTRDGQAASRINGAHADARWKVDAKRSDLRAIVVSSAPKSRAVYALTAGGDVLRRAGMSAMQPAGEGWTKLLGSLTSLAVTARDALWGVNAEGKVFYKSSASDAASWTKVAGAELRSLSAAGRSHVVGLTADGAIIRRLNITRRAPTGAAWSKPTKDAAVAVDFLAVGPKGQLWALDKSGSCFYRAPASTEWQVVVAPVKFASLSVAADGGLVAVGREPATIYVREGIMPRARVGMGTAWVQLTHSDTLRAVHVAAGSSLTPLRDSRLDKTAAQYIAEAEARAARSRNFILRFQQANSTFGGMGDSAIIVAVARLMGVAPERLQLASTRPSSADAKATVVSFRISRDKRPPFMGTDAEGRAAAPPPNAFRALRSLAAALNSTATMAQDENSPIKHVVSSSLRLVRGNGDLVVIPARPLRRRGPAAGPHAHVGLQSRVVFLRGGKPAPRALRLGGVTVGPPAVYLSASNGKISLRTLKDKKSKDKKSKKPKTAAKGKKGKKKQSKKQEKQPRSQRWLMNPAGQLSFSDKSGVRQCMTAARPQTAPVSKGQPATPASRIGSRVLVRPCDAFVGEVSQRFEWSVEHNTLRHVDSGLCLTAAPEKKEADAKTPAKKKDGKNKKSKGQSKKSKQSRGAPVPVVLRKCLRPLAPFQKFAFEAIPRSPRAPREQSRRVSLTIAQPLAQLGANFTTRAARELAIGTGVSIARFNVSAPVAGAQPASSLVHVRVVRAPHKSGELNVTETLNALRTALASPSSPLRAAKGAIFGGPVAPLLVVEALKKPAPKTRYSKVAFFDVSAPMTTVMEAAWGGAPGPARAIVVAKHDAMAPSQRFAFRAELGALTFQDRANNTWCVAVQQPAPVPVPAAASAAAPASATLALVGAKLVSEPCDPKSAAQKFAHDAQAQTLQHVASGLCVELPQGKSAPGGVVVLARCGASRPQSWDFPARYPRALRRQLSVARKAKRAAVVQAKQAVAKQAQQVAQAAQVAAKAAVKAAQKKEEIAKAAAAVAQEAADKVKLLGLAQSLPKNTYTRSAGAILASKAAPTHTGLSCREISSMFGVAAGRSIGFHTPALYRAAWAAKRCATQPLDCQALADCYDFHNMAANNAAAVASGFAAPVNASDSQPSAPFAPFLIAQRFLGSFRHEAHAHGFHGAAEHVSGAADPERSISHSQADHDDHASHAHAQHHAHGEQCAGVAPLDCRGMSNHYGMSATFAGSAPKCVQKKFRLLRCTTSPDQTCQVLSNRYSLGMRHPPASDVAAKRVLSARFMQLAASPEALAVQTTEAAALTAAAYLPPPDAVRSFAAQQCSTRPLDCQTLSTQHNTWRGHAGSMSRDTYRQFLLRNCATRPMLSCSQLSDSFLFGDPQRHPRPAAHGHSAESLGAVVFAAHEAASQNSEATSFMELASSSTATATATASYTAETLRNTPFKRVHAAYFQQWTAQKCKTQPHSCQELSNVFGLSPFSQGAASKAIARTFTAVLRCATQPLLDCAELAAIHSVTVDSVAFAAPFLQAQWNTQKCNSSALPTCRQLSDAYDLPNGEWAKYAPAGVHAQFRALGCRTVPLPTCQALSDRYLIHHAQTDAKQLAPEAGRADRLVLAKYSRWGCHHRPRDCQQISNFFGLARDAQSGKLTSAGPVPHFARELYRFRKCDTSPAPGSAPGKN